MGCDIHIFCEQRINGKWEYVSNHFSQSDFDKQYSGKEKADAPFDWRSYSMYGFMAGVRNYSHCHVLSEPKGLPGDSEYLNSPSRYAYDTNPMNGESIPIEEQETNRQDIEDGNYHSKSWLTLSELLSFDYDQQFEDLRYTKQTSPNVYDGSAVATPGDGNGTWTTYRDFLGGGFFTHLEEMKQLGAPEDVRIVFWFDS